jgi:hypothetical protein
MTTPGNCNPFRTARTSREALQLIAGGAPRVILVVPGWLYSNALRAPILLQVVRLRSAAGPVHARWLWLREDEDGRTETAFLVWPCTTLHPPWFQCMDGRVAHGNTPFAGRPLIPAP